MEQELHTVPTVENKELPQSTKKDGWSWGGFMFDPVVIVASKKYAMLLLYLLLVIPLS